ncbi:MAG: sigma-70 family RNA polymerase sigma factor [Alistipes sp.]|jgi:RNA polymerase sigma-70 factor (ECF subfamily)|nr:sigma-70 family RNA polymerase sigma factor [Alistipes sp.]
MKAQTKEELFCDVVHAHRNIIYKVCYIYAPKGMIEDYYQEVLINLWKSFDQFEGRSKHSTWIYRVALYTCISFIRRKRPVSISLSFDLSSEEDAHLREQIEELHSVISRLGNIDRALIMLWLEGYAYDEMAEITGLSQSNVSVKLMRAKNKIKEMFNA